MQLPINHFKRALRERRAQIGLWLSAGSPYVAEAVAGSVLAPMAWPRRRSARSV